MSIFRMKFNAIFQLLKHNKFMLVIGNESKDVITNFNDSEVAKSRAATGKLSIYIN